MHNNLTKVYEYMDSEALEKGMKCKHLAKHIEQMLHYPDSFLSDACIVADIGMTFISPEIKNKIEPLLPSEKEVINMHPIFGYKLLKDFGLDDLADVVAIHHSPNGLEPLGFNFNETVNEKLQKTAMQVHTIDVFIALITDRPYRSAFSSDEAYNYLLENEKFFDADVCKCIKSLIEMEEL